MLLLEFAARAERAGWLTPQRELSERHRDDERLAHAILEDADALLRRADLLSGVEQAIEQGLRYVRRRRVAVGDLGYEPAYGQEVSSPADRVRRALVDLDATIADGRPRGALLLYDEAHLLADDRSRERYPLSGLLAALGAVQTSRAACPNRPVRTSDPKYTDSQVGERNESAHAACARALGCSPARTRWRSSRVKRHSKGVATAL